MEMPDTIEIYKHYTEISPHKTEYEIELWQAEYDHSDGETYHHSRIVEALKAENEELKAKLDKAKYGLKDIARQYKSTEWEEEGDTEYGYDMIIERARTTLEEIE